ncbi:MAG: hypothetical protein KGL46_13370 [Hyphomicrobiales bacterium]|nr:hypothetical protein [Hyphomicrobiales bacterium]
MDEKADKTPRDGLHPISEDAALDPKIQEQLGRTFRAYCDDLIAEPIPDTFLVLLAKLEAKERSGE